MLLTHKISYSKIEIKIFDISSGFAIRVYKSAPSTLRNLQKALNIDKKHKK